VRHGLAGLEGLIELYRYYRQLTDQLYADLDIPKISIENSRKEWAKYEETIVSILMNPHETAEVANSLLPRAG